MKELKQVWQFDSHDEFKGSELQCNPLVLDGVLYGSTPRVRVVALDAATGKQIWDFDAHRGEQIRTKLRNRGLTWWGEGDERWIFVRIDQYLYALSTKTGQPIASFGENGRIDLHEGLGDNLKDLTVQATSPGFVYKDMLIQGTLVAEGLPTAPGHIRAFDVRTGKVRQYVWKKPFGEFPALATKGMHDTGSENYGGGVVTADGLLFITATTHDHKIRAFDKLSGDCLWEATLPASGNATSSLYEVNGKEYVAIPAGGGKWARRVAEAM